MECGTGTPVVRWGSFNGDLRPLPSLQFRFNVLGHHAHPGHSRPELLFRTTKLPRPISEFVALLHIDALGILRAGIGFVVGHALRAGCEGVCFCLRLHQWNRVPSGLGDWRHFALHGPAVHFQIL